MPDSKQGLVPRFTHMQRIDPSSPRISSRDADMLKLLVDRIHNKEKHGSDADADVDADTGVDADDVTSQTPLSVEKSFRLLKNSVEMIRDHISKTDPKVEDVISGKMSISDKALILQWFDILKTTQVVSEDRINIKEKISELILIANERALYYESLSEDDKKIVDDEKNKILIDPILRLRLDIIKLKTTEKNKKHLLRDLNYLAGTKHRGDEYNKIKKRIRLSTTIPFNSPKLYEIGIERKKFLHNIHIGLNKKFYGMNHVKEQLMVFINSRINNPLIKHNCVGLVGPAGAGKTSIIKEMSKLGEFPIVSIPCGGVSEPETLRGFSIPYIGARPGMIINAFIDLKCNNGIMFLDEFEKVSENEKLLSTLLEMLDPERNEAFVDNYFDNLNIDLSKVWFILSMNKLPENSALRDRIFEIKVDGYTRDDKCQILEKYIMPKLLREINAEKDQITINPGAITYFVNKFSRDEGVRRLENYVRYFIHKLRFLKDNPLFLKKYNIKTLKWPIHITQKLITYLTGDDVVEDRRHEFYG